MTEGAKICTKCKEEKLAILEYFSWRKDTNKFRNQCKSCEEKKKKEWSDKNPEKEANKESKKRQYIRLPWKFAWRGALYGALKRLGREKEGKTIDLLGYSALQLKKHMENQFEKGMTWENHGKWHIDHIKPVSKFRSDSLISEVNALENLQPLWAEENLRKSNREQ